MELHDNINKKVTGRNINNELLTYNFSCGFIFRQSFTGNLSDSPFFKTADNVTSAP
ncbi:hypothetical protein CHCC20335_2379 [Bacillus paralicheniformis]|nr:hypothetical protein CHCC20335_2379 [Bacillus paralicheniformis]